MNINSIVTEIVDIYKSKFDIFNEDQLELIVEEYYKKNGHPEDDVINLIWDRCNEILINEMNSHG